MAEQAVSAAARPSRSSASRLRGLDGMRFVAAAAVVSYHFTGIATKYWGVKPAVKFPTLNHITRYGFVGVEFFFMISGFVILMTAYGRTIDDFVASRFSRLFPAYWVAVIVTSVLQFFWTAGRPFSVVGGMVNLTMMEGAFDVTSTQGAFWTLWVELKFYLLLGIFVLVGITRRRVIAFAMIWPILGHIATVTHQGLLNSLLFPTYAPYFALGMLLYLVYRDGNDLVVWLGIAMNLVWCIQHLTGYASRESELVGAPVSGLVLSVIVVVMVVVIWAVSSGPLARLDWRWLTVAGALTYPLYLIHAQFGFFVIDRLHDKLNSYLVLAVAVVLALLLALGLHYGVENRVHRRLRTMIRDALGRAVGSGKTPAVRGRLQSRSAAAVDDAARETRASEQIG